MSKTPNHTVVDTGAVAGDILIGIHAESNTGLLIEVLEPQPIGTGGRIRGPFRILHQGTGRYASGIESVLQTKPIHQNAGEFIGLVSRKPGCEKCTHILNANALAKFNAAEVRRFILRGDEQEAPSEEILRCTSCGQIYYDLSLNFCLSDGTRLSSETAETETVVSNHTKLGVERHAAPDEETVFMQNPGKDIGGYEFIRNAVAKHSNLDLLVHQGSNHRISKSGHTGSVWIIPRHGGVSITANGQSAQQLYSEMERILGTHHREDVKGYRYWQADHESDVEHIIESWSKI